MWRTARRLAAARRARPAVRALRRPGAALAATAAAAAAVSAPAAAAESDAGHADGDDGLDLGDDCPICVAVREGECGEQFEAYTGCVREWYGKLTRAQAAAEEAGEDASAVVVDMSDDWKRRFAQTAAAYRVCCDANPAAKELAMLISPHLWPREEEEGEGRAASPAAEEGRQAQQ